MKSICFFVPGKPQGKGRPRFARTSRGVRTYTPAETTLYEHHIAQCCKQAADNYMFPDDTPLEMRIRATFLVPKSYSRRKRDACLSGLIRPTCKPDMDNIAKCVADALNGVVYRDDSRIFKLVIVKEYGTKEGLTVTVSEERKSFEQETVEEWGERRAENAETD